jgi:hypothetical protein
VLALLRDETARQHTPPHFSLSLLHTFTFTLYITIMHGQDRSTPNMGTPFFPPQIPRALIQYLFITIILHASLVLAQTQTVPTVTRTLTLTASASITATAVCLDGNYIDNVVSKLANQPVASPPALGTTVGLKTVFTTISVPRIQQVWQTTNDINPVTSTVTFNGAPFTYVAWPDITVCADTDESTATSMMTTVTRVIVTRPGIAATKPATEGPASRIPVTRPGAPTTPPTITSAPTDSALDTWVDDTDDTGGDFLADDPTVPEVTETAVEPTDASTVFVTITYAQGGDQTTDPTPPTVAAQLLVHSSRFSATFCKTMLSSAANAVQGTCAQVCTMFISTPENAASASTRMEIASCQVLCEARTGGLPLSTSCDNLFALTFYGITNATPVQTAAVTGLPMDNGGAPEGLNGAPTPEDGLIPMAEPSETPVADTNIIPVDDSAIDVPTDAALDQEDPTLTGLDQEDTPMSELDSALPGSDPGFVINVPTTKKPTSTKKLTSTKTQAVKSPAQDQILKSGSGNGLTKISRPTASALQSSSIKPFALLFIAFIFI